MNYYRSTNRISNTIPMGTSKLWSSATVVLFFIRHNISIVQPERRKWLMPRTFYVIAEVVKINVDEQYENVDLLFRFGVFTIIATLPCANSAHSMLLIWWLSPKKFQNKNTYIDKRNLHDYVCLYMRVFCALQTPRVICTTRSARIHVQPFKNKHTHLCVLRTHYVLCVIFNNVCHVDCKVTSFHTSKANANTQTQTIHDRLNILIIVNNSLSISFALANTYVVHTAKGGPIQTTYYKDTQKERERKTRQTNPII